MLVSLVKKSLGKYKPGTIFEFPDKQAKIMVRVGIMRAEPTEHADVEISARTGRPKRTYTRRDMRAES